MAVRIDASDYPNERGTLKVTISFTDESGDAVTPATVTWSLTDENGTVINSRSNVSIGSLDTSVTLVLSGADLALVNASVDRILTVRITYDSDLGSGLTENEEALFKINPLVNVT